MCEDNNNKERKWCCKLETEDDVVERVGKDAGGRRGAEALCGGREAVEAAQRGACLGALGHHLAGGHCVCGDTL